MNLFEKTFNFWFAVIGAAIYVYTSHKDLPFIPRMLKVVSATLIGVSTHEELALRIGGSENLTLVAVIVLSWVTIDASVTLILNHKDLISLIRKVTGK